jgi:quercetin 2,3-dioxygenase
MLTQLPGPGDFLQVPAGTTHSYRIDAAYTRFIGPLAPGLFEPFFRAMCEPFDGHVNPPIPGPVRFDRVMQQLGDLDLVLTERPSGPPSH